MYKWPVSLDCNPYQDVWLQICEIRANVLVVGKRVHEEVKPLLVIPILKELVDNFLDNSVPALTIDLGDVLAVGEVAFVSAVLFDNTRRRKNRNSFPLLVVSPCLTEPYL